MILMRIFRKCCGSAGGVVVLIEVSLNECNQRGREGERERTRDRLDHQLISTTKEKVKVKLDKDKR